MTNLPFAHATSPITGSNRGGIRAEIDHERLLTFGFDPSPGQDPFHLLAEWSLQQQPVAEPLSRGDAVPAGVATQREALTQSLRESDHERQHVVLLSGGLDSRILLALVIEQFGVDRVLAVTFGEPGEQDFDYAKVVARRVGVRHRTLRTFSLPWTTDGLVESVLARGAPLPFPFGQRYLSYHAHKMVGRHAVFWDGLCGDVISGGLLPRVGEPWDWEPAKAKWLADHVRVGVLRFLRPDFDPAACLPAQPWCDGSVLSYPEQLDYALRQGQYISTRILRDYDVRTPFLRRAFLDFWLTRANSYRDRDQTLYYEVQLAAFPELFSLPTTSGPSANPAPALVQRVFRAIRRRVTFRRRLPGLDTSGANAAIRNAFRYRADIKSLFLQNLADLHGRGILSFGDLTPAAIVDGAVDSRTACALFDLEINLKAAGAVGERAA